MGPGFLIDTNIVIAYLDNTLPEKGTALVDSIEPYISVITRIELLGWPQINQDDLDKLNAFIINADIYPLDEPVILSAIALRRHHRIKIPDAIIAATALVHDLKLLSRNTSDFKNIPGLLLVNPYD